MTDTGMVSSQVDPRDGGAQPEKSGWVGWVFFAGVLDEGVQWEERPWQPCRFRAVAHDFPDQMPVVVRDHYQEMITLGQFRAVIDGLPDEVPLEIAIRDRWHFNQLLGDLPVTGIAVTQEPTSPVIVLDVPGIS